MKIVRARYENEIVIVSKSIVPDGFSCIAFQNLGDAPATVMNNIDLPTTGDERNFTETPGIIIASHFPVIFTGAGDHPKVLVVKTYYDISHGIPE
jgi:hypothetical protein